MLGNARTATMAGLNALGLALAACSGAASTGDSAASTDRDAASPTPSAAASPVETELPAARPVDVEATPIEPRVEARVELPGGPDYLAAAAGSIWVRKDDGVVERIDPADSTEIATITTSEDLCQGLGADDAAVWSCTDGGGVVRIDPATNEVAATVEVSKYNDQGHIPVAFGRAWVLVDDGSRLVGIADDAVDVDIDLGSNCIQLVASDTALWVVCLTDGLVLAVDPDSGEITTRVPGLEGARNIAVADDVWVGFDGGLARIDAASGRVTGVADVPSGFSGHVVATADDVWVRTGGRFLRHVEADTMEVVEELHAPEVSGDFVLVASDSVWTTAYDDAVLYRVAPTP